MSSISILSGAGSIAGLQSIWGVGARNGNDNGTDAGDAGSVKGKSSPFLQAIEQALSQIGIDGSGSSSQTSTSASSSDTSSDSTDTTGDTQAAVQSFLQTLLAALQQAGTAPPPPPDGTDGNSGSTVDAGFTQDQLTSMASQLGATDSSGAQFLSNLAANFDTADTNGDGKIDPQEAQAFAQSSGAAGASGTPHFHHGGKSHLEADINSLLQQLSASDSSTDSTTDSSTDSDTSASSGSDGSTVAQLQQSFQNLLSTLGASNDQASLGSFLQALENNLQGATPTGNIVSTKA